MDLEPSVASKIVAEWQAAPQKNKTLVIDRWSKVLGCSRQGLYKMLPTCQKMGRHNQRPKGDCLINGLSDAVEIVAAIKKRPPVGRKEITTECAIKLAVGNGLLPEYFENVSLSTFNAHIREKGFNKKKKRVVRFQAERPNQLHHIDASSSECFYVDKRLSDGDFILKLDNRPHKGYKNKIIKVDRLRPWIYGLVDDHSGYHVAQYVAAAGESMADNLLFLEWVWTKNEDKELFGLPENLKADCGPLMKGQAANDILERLGINIDPSTPYASRTHGKIERPWRTLWQKFELPFFMENWKTFEIRLSELQRRFLIYQKEYNLKKHRFEKKISRLDAWRRVNHFGGVVEMPKDAIRTAARRIERTVGSDGRLPLDGIIYEVEGLHDAKVLVWKGIFDDKIVVKDLQTGEKYPAIPFKPLNYGEYRGVAKSPHEKAVETSSIFELSNTLYTEPKKSKTSNYFATRTKEIRNIEDLLDANSYLNIEAAMQDFTAYCGFAMDAEDRETVKKYILQNNGLNKNFVRDLALEVQAEKERSVNYG